MVLLALGVFARPAAATTLVMPDGTQRPQPYQRWLDRAQVPTPPGTVTLALGACAGGYSWAVGCTDVLSRTIYLGAEGRARDVLLHELGHVFDEHVMTAPARARFQRLLGLSGAWSAAAETDPPQEQFAEAYSICARARTLKASFYGMYAYSVTPRKHRRVCALIRSAARSATA